MSVQLSTQGDCVARIEISKDATPSWKRSCEAKGVATLDCRAHKEAGWLAIDASEYNSTSNRMVKTMLSFNPEEARALRDWLVANLPQ